MWVATDGDRIVGLRAFMRWEFVRGGDVLRAVRAVDTATHPDYQGKGLFTAMTMHGLDVIRDDGIDFVFNTPNDKSRPGYLKMGWQEVGKLPVAIRVAGPGGAVRMARSRVASSHWPLDVALGEPVMDVVADLAVDVESTLDRSTIATNVSTRFYEWRYGADFLGYRAVAGDGGHLVCRVRRRGDAKELVMLDSPGLDISSADRIAEAPAASQRAGSCAPDRCARCSQWVRTGAGRAGRHLAFGVRRSDASARELARRHGRRGVVLRMRLRSAHRAFVFRVADQADCGSREVSRASVLAFRMLSPTVLLDDNPAQSHLCVRGFSHR